MCRYINGAVLYVSITNSSNPPIQRSMETVYAGITGEAEVTGKWRDPVCLISMLCAGMCLHMYILIVMLISII